MLDTSRLSSPLPNLVILRPPLPPIIIDPSTPTRRLTIITLKDEDELVSPYVYLSLTFPI